MIFLYKEKQSCQRYVKQIKGFLAFISDFTLHLEILYSFKRKNDLLVKEQPLSCNLKTGLVKRYPLYRTQTTYPKHLYVNKEHSVILWSLWRSQYYFYCYFVHGLLLHPTIKLWGKPTVCKFGVISQFSAGITAFNDLTSTKLILNTVTLCRLSVINYTC